MLDPAADPALLGPYYMLFDRKADYDSHLDGDGIPMLDYHGDVGLQYNPIAIAQFGLGNYNLYKRNGDQLRRQKMISAADWLVANLEPHAAGTYVWKHHFDWEYRDLLKSGWHSALSQGQGISLLVRAADESGNPDYATAARSAFGAFETDVENGGVCHTDSDGQLWFEETIVDPPTHILNGFMWASWDVYDYALWSGEPGPMQLFDRAVETIRTNLHRFDAGYWSMYEQAGKRMTMLASAFYHSLHITQLRVMHLITGDPIFLQYADKWDGYRRSAVNRFRARAYKSVFKVLYY
jgi:hypothetical protein